MEKTPDFNSIVRFVHYAGPGHMGDTDPFVEYEGQQDIKWQDYLNKICTVYDVLPESGDGGEEMVMCKFEDGVIGCFYPAEIDYV